MGITIGPTLQGFPSRAIPTVVHLKKQWSDPWKFIPELEFLGGNVSTAAQGIDACSLLYRYGVLKNPWESTDGAKYPASLDGYWVRVGLAGNQGMQQAWIGRITGEVRAIFGSRETDYGLVPAGSQCFNALGPLAILRRIDVGRSYWRINNETVPIHWVTSLNEKYGRTDKPSGTPGKSLGSGPGAKNPGSRSGNRSTEKDEDEVYVHGETELWNYLQYAQYLLAKFVDESKTDGPSWRMGGQCDVLSVFTDPVQFGVVSSVDENSPRLYSP